MGGLRAIGGRGRPPKERALHALEKTLLGNPQTPEISDLVRANFEHTLGSC